MPSTNNLTEQSGIARPDGDDAWAGRLPLEGLARRAMRVTWCWPVLLTLVLGLYQIDRPELWRDELASWSLATRPLPDLIATARHIDATDLAYYLLLHFWIAAFGDSTYAMRGLSVLAMAAAAACVTLTGQKLAGVRAGLVAGLVFGLTPSVSRFAQETRPYALDVLVATLATLLLLRALDQPTSRRWVAYGVCVAVLGNLDLIALSVLVGHATGTAMRWWQDRDNRQFWFGPTVLAGIAACLPLAAVGTSQAGGQVQWILRPGLDLTAFSAFGRNLFFSTSVAAVLVMLAVLAWAVNRQAAAFATALAVLPVAAVWLVSQGPHSYFFPRYLLYTVAAWAILAGIALSRIDLRIAVAAVAAVAVFGAGDQEVIRMPGAHDWASYPVSSGGYWVDYAGAASIIASRLQEGDGAVYPSATAGFLLVDVGVQYYLRRDLRSGTALPRELFVAGPSVLARHLYPILCEPTAACLGQDPRIWVVGSGDFRNPYAAVSPDEAAALRKFYAPEPELTQHVPGLTVFLLARV